MPPLPPIAPPLPPIAIVGLGTMGLGIAQVFAQAGHPVLATDAFAPARAHARDRLSASLAPRVAFGKLPSSEAAAILARLTVAEGLESLAPAALMIEAVAEDLAVKQALFQRLEALNPAALRATNTSSLRVADIALGLRHPDRLVGLHFFNPAPVMKLVELIAPEGPSRAEAEALMQASGKTLIPAPDTPGFIVNRCARPFYGEALALLTEGRKAAEIDAAMVAQGYRMGPFALIDLVGADINLAATRSLAQAMGQHPRYHVFEALVAQVASGHLGRKTGLGFIGPGAAATPPPADTAEIVARIEAALVNEALWLACSTGTPGAAIDTALRLGLNFPRGPFALWADHGPAIRATLARLEAAAPPALKSRYLMPETLP